MNKRPRRSKNVSTRKKCVERLFKRYMFHLRRVNIFTNQKDTEEEEGHKAKPKQNCSCWDNKGQQALATIKLRFRDDHDIGN